MLSDNFLKKEISQLKRGKKKVEAHEESIKLKEHYGVHCMQMNLHVLSDFFLVRGDSSVIAEGNFELLIQTKKLYSKVISLNPKNNHSK